MTEFLQDCFDNATGSNFEFISCAAPKIVESFTLFRSTSSSAILSWISFYDNEVPTPSFTQIAQEIIQEVKDTDDFYNQQFNELFTFLFGENPAVEDIRQIALFFFREQFKRNNTSVNYGNGIAKAYIADMNTNISAAVANIGLQRDTDKLVAGSAFRLQQYQTNGQPVIPLSPPLSGIGYTTADSDFVNAQTDVFEQQVLDSTPELTPFFGLTDTENFNIMDGFNPFFLSNLIYAIYNEFVLLDQQRKSDFALFFQESIYPIDVDAETSEEVSDVGIVNDVFEESKQNVFENFLNQSAFTDTIIANDTFIVSSFFDHLFSQNGYTTSTFSVRNVFLENLTGFITGNVNNTLFLNCQNNNPPILVYQCMVDKFQSLRSNAEELFQSLFIVCIDNTPAETRTNFYQNQFEFIREESIYKTLSIENEVCGIFIDFISQNNNDILYNIASHEIKITPEDLTFLPSWTNEITGEAKTSDIAITELVEESKTNVNLFLAETPVQCVLNDIDAISNPPFKQKARSKLDTEIFANFTLFNDTWSNNFFNITRFTILFFTSGQQNVFSEYLTQQEFQNKLELEVEEGLALVQTAQNLTAQINANPTLLTFSKEEIEDCFQQRGGRECLKEYLIARLNSAYSIFDENYSQKLSQNEDNNTLTPNLFFLNEYRSDALVNCFNENMPFTDQLENCVTEFLENNTTEGSNGILGSVKGYISQAQNLFNTVIAKPEVDLQKFIDDDLLKVIPSNLTLEQYLFLSCFRLGKLTEADIVNCINAEYERLKVARESLNIIFDAVFKNEIERLNVPKKLVDKIREKSRSACDNFIGLETLQNCINVEIRKEIFLNIFNFVYNDVIDTVAKNYLLEVDFTPPFFKQYAFNKCNDQTLSFDQENEIRECVKDSAEEYFTFLQKKTYFGNAYISCFYTFIILTILLFFISLILCFIYEQNYNQEIFITGVILFILFIISFIVMCICIRDYVIVKNKFNNKFN